MKTKLDKKQLKSIRKLAYDYEKAEIDPKYIESYVKGIILGYIQGYLDGEKSTKKAKK